MTQQIPQPNGRPTPRVSVVVPAWNSGAYLAQTIESVLAQTFTDFELVLADHSSTDDTASVIERYRDEPRVRVLEPTPAGGGALRNWNRVSRAARGELLKLLPGDDLLHPEILRRQVEAFDAHPSVALGCTNRSMVDARGRVLVASRGLPRGIRGLVDGARVVRTTVRVGANIYGEPGAVMMRRALLEEVGWWDNTNPFVIDERTCSMVVLAGRRHGQGDVYAIAEPLASFRINAGQWSVRLSRQQAAQAAAFHDDLLRLHPEVVSPADVRLGNAMVRLAALRRQAVYRLLGTRMAPAPAPVTSDHNVGRPAG